MASKLFFRPFFKVAGFLILFTLAFWSSNAQEKIPEFNHFFIDGDKYILVAVNHNNADTGHIWVCTPEGIILSKRLMGYSHSNSKYNSRQSVLGFHYGSHSLIYRSGNFLFSYSVTNLEEKLIFEETQEISDKYYEDGYTDIVYYFDPSTGTVFIGTTPEKLELDILTGKTREIILPEGHFPVKKLTTNSYLIAEDVELEDDFYTRQTVYAYNTTTKQKSKALLSGACLLGVPTGDYIVYGIFHSEKSTVYNTQKQISQSIKGTLGSPNGQSLADGSLVISNKDGCFLYNPATSVKKQLGYANGLWSYDIAKKMLIQFEPKELKAYQVRNTGEPLAVFDLRNDPGVPKFVCSYQSTIIATFDTKGNPFASSVNGTYSWPHFAQFNAQGIETVWEDMNLDGYNDLIIIYPHWQKDKKAIDLLFSDKAGGFTGYHRLKINGNNVFTSPGVLLALDDATPFLNNKLNLTGWRLSFNAQTRSLELFEINGKTDKKLRNEFSDYCEQCKDNQNNLTYKYYAWQKPEKSDNWTISFNNKPLERVSRISEKFFASDYNNDGLMDRMSASDDRYKKYSGLSKDSLPIRHVEFSIMKKDGEYDKRLFTLEDNVAFMAVGDYNGDNFPDLSIGHNSNRKRLSIIYGASQLHAFEMKTYDTKEDCQVLLAVDINNDGKAELISRSGSDFIVLYFNKQKELQKETVEKDILFSEFHYMAFDRINNDDVLDYVAVSLFDTEKDHITAVPYLGEITNNQYVLHGAKKKWMDFETPLKEYLKEYAEWQERQKKAEGSKRPYCSICKGTGASYSNQECSNCYSCSGSGKITSYGQGVSTRYETRNGREVLVTRMYNTGSSSGCSSCSGSGRICRTGISFCGHCHGTGREP